MNNIEDLLREALTTTPAPTPTVDPLGGLDRRIRRARRWMATGAGIGVAAVTAAVVVPLATVGGTQAGNLQYGHQSPSPSATASGIPGLQVIDVWQQSGAAAVASGDGGLWALTIGGTSTPEGDAVQQFNPVDGRRIGSPIAVPSPADFISVGLNRVWVYGGGDGAYGDLSVISAIDPANGHVETLRIHGKGGPQAMVFASQQAFVSLAVANEVVSVGGVTGPLAEGQPVAVPGQPTSMVVMNDGSVWVDESLNRKWAHLDVAEGHSKLLGTVDWNAPIFGLSPHNSVWTRDTRLIEINPASLSQCVSCAYGARIPTPGRPTAVAATDSGGLFVVTDASAGQRGGIAYYTAQDVQRESNSPSAFLAVDGVYWLAADPAGGVVYVDGTSRLAHWVPPTG